MTAGLCGTGRHILPDKHKLMQKKVELEKSKYYHPPVTSSPDLAAAVTASSLKRHIAFQEERVLHWETTEFVTCPSRLK